MTFHQKLSAYTLGLLTDKDLPRIAMTGLEEGYHSESVRILAGRPSTDNSFVLHDYFIKALKELELTLADRKAALISVIAFYAKQMAEKRMDAYAGFEIIQYIFSKTEFYYDDIGLMPVYTAYISIWEEKMDGLDFHTVEGLTKEKYIEKTKEEMRRCLEQWLINYNVS